MRALPIDDGLSFDADAMSFYTRRRCGLFDCGIISWTLICRLALLKASAYMFVYSHLQKVATKLLMRHFTIMFFQYFTGIILHYDNKNAGRPPRRAPHGSLCR